MILGITETTLLSDYVPLLFLALSVVAALSLINLVMVVSTVSRLKQQAERNHELNKSMRDMLFASNGCMNTIQTQLIKFKRLEGVDEDG